MWDNPHRRTRSFTSRCCLIKGAALVRRCGSGRAGAATVRCCSTAVDGCDAPPEYCVALRGCNAGPGVLRCALGAGAWLSKETVE